MTWPHLGETEQAEALRELREGLLVLVLVLHARPPLIWQAEALRELREVLPEFSQEDFL